MVRAKEQMMKNQGTEEYGQSTRITANNERGARKQITRAKGVRKQEWRRI